MIVISGLLFSGVLAWSGIRLSTQTHPSSFPPVVASRTVPAVDTIPDILPTTVAQFISPDRAWIAFASGTVIGFNGQTSGELRLISTDGLSGWSLLPSQLGVTANCECEAQIMGWGNGILWLETEFVEGGGIQTFVAISTSGRSVSEYPSRVSDISFRNSINLDRGSFVWSDRPSGPNQQVFAQASPMFYSYWVYRIASGTQVLLETSTMKLIPADEVSFGRSLKWIGTTTLQYYDFSSKTLATTSVP